MLSPKNLFKVQNSKTVKLYIYVILIAISIIYYFFRLLYYAKTVPHYIPPDEITHFAYSVIFSQSWEWPVNIEETYRFGNVEDIPWLYYYLMGKGLLFNILPLSDLVFLRCLNVLLSVGTVTYSYCWIRLISRNRSVHFFFLVLLTNIPMLTFLGAAVNYDNLVIFLAVMALFHTHYLFRNRRFVHFLLAGIALTAGSLTKISFLPLIPIFLIILFFHERKTIRSLPHLFKHMRWQLSGSGKFLLVVFLVLLTFNLELYGVNIITYGKLVPQAGQVMSEEQFMLQRIAARDYVAKQYRNGEWSYERSLEEAKKIAHPGDRRTALHLLKLQRLGKEGKRDDLSRLAYAYKWFPTILSNTVGLCAHSPMVKKTGELVIYETIFLFAFLCAVRYWKLESPGFVMNQSIFIVLCYGLFLMQFHNYSIYAWSLNPTLGIQGRYMFPVLVPLLGIFSYYIATSFPKYISYLLIICISIFFIWGDFPYFLENADTDWFNVPRIVPFQMVK